MSRATLHNEEEIARKDIREGDTVIIEKAGEIIPAVIEVVLAKRPDSAKPFTLKKKCPECGTAASKVAEDDVVWRCANPDCPAQVRGRLEHYCARGAMDIEGGGEVLVKQIVARGLAYDVGELYRLSWRKWRALSGWRRNPRRIFGWLGDQQRSRLVAVGVWTGYFARGRRRGEGVVPALSRSG